MSKEVKLLTPKRRWLILIFFSKDAVRESTHQIHPAFS